MELNNFYHPERLLGTVQDEGYFGFLEEARNAPFSCSLNQQIIGKPSFVVDENGVKKLNKHGKPFVLMHPKLFKNMSDEWLTNERLFKFKAYYGYALCPVFVDEGAGRNDNNVVGTKIVEFDFDNTWSIEEAVSHEFWKYCFGLYATPSFGKIQNALSDNDKKNKPADQVAVIETRVDQPKNNFRMIARLGRMLMKDEIKHFYRGAFVLFPMADHATSDASRQFYGCADAPVQLFNKDAEVIPEWLITEMIEAGKAVGELRKNGGGIGHANIGGVKHTYKASADTGDFSENLDILFKDESIMSVEDIIATFPAGKKVGACYSPFRDEVNASAFVGLSGGGKLYIRDSGMDTTYWYNPPETKLDFSKFKKSTEKPAVKASKQQAPLVEYSELLEFEPERVYEVAPTEKERQVKLKAIIENLGYYNLVITNEGYGKSYMIMGLLKKTHKVIIACVSNKQAEDKYNDIVSWTKQRENFGLMFDRVQHLWSRSYAFEKAMDFQVKCVRKTLAYDPFDDDEIDELATKVAVQEAFPAFTTEEIDKLWEEHYEDAYVPKLDLSCDVIVTSFARADIIGKTENNKLGPEWVVMYDDPVFGNLKRLVKYDENIVRLRNQVNAKRRFENKEELPHLEEVEVMLAAGDKALRYFVRPLDKTPGHSFKPHEYTTTQVDGGIETVTMVVNPIIYTTTEMVTHYLLRAYKPDVKLPKNKPVLVEHDDLRDLKAGNVHLWGTKMVWAKYDGLITPMVESLKKNGYEDLVLIGDGLGAKLNHTTNKGANGLKTMDIVIELSEPNPEALNGHHAEMVYAAKFIDKKPFQKNSVKKLMMVDNLNQAVGRNSGLRYGGGQSIILCPPSIIEDLHDGLRYEATVAMCIDRDTNYSRDKERKEQLEKYGSGLCQEFMTMLREPATFAMSKNMADAVDGLDSHTQFARLIKALDAIAEDGEARLSKVRTNAEVKHIEQYLAIHGSLKALVNEKKSNFVKKILLK